MRSLTKSLVSFLKKEDGPTAVEYAVMLALIIVVCIAAITTLGSQRQRDVQLRRLVHQAADLSMTDGWARGPTAEPVSGRASMARPVSRWRPPSSQAHGYDRLPDSPPR